GKDGRKRTAKPKKPRRKKPSAKQIAAAVATLPDEVKQQVEQAVAAAKPEPAPDEKPWVDDWGIAITQDAVKAFQAQELFDALLKQLRACRQLYKELANHPGGAYLTRPGVSINARDSWKHAGLETCILNVQDCRPTYTVCPYAYSGAENYKHGKDCTL